MNTRVISKEKLINKQKQRGEYICYAASIAAFLETKKITYEQEDIVKMVHSEFVDQGATVEQIINVLESILKVQFFYYPVRIHKKCNSQQWLVNFFEKEGPFVIGFKPTIDDVHHMGVLHTIHITEEGDIAQMEFYDPYHGESRIVRSETEYIYVFREKEVSRFKD